MPAQKGLSENNLAHLCLRSRIKVLTYFKLEVANTNISFLITLGGGGGGYLPPCFFLCETLHAYTLPN